MERKGIIKDFTFHPEGKINFYKLLWQCMEQSSAFLESKCQPNAGGYCMSGDHLHCWIHSLVTINVSTNLSNSC